MNKSQSEVSEKTLQQPEIHEQWVDSFRTKKNAKFYELAFDYIAAFLDAEKDSTVLDVGCGTCAHSVRLAKRGFTVLAVDFSEYALKNADLAIQSIGLAQKIKLQQENLLSLSFDEKTFDYILCWGVLMHIPDIEKAISELNRVLKRNGILVISEGNMFSLQSIFTRAIWSFSRKDKITINRTPAGIEYWKSTSSGKILIRNSNIRWIKDSFRNYGYEIKKHVAGQFTELYTSFSSELINGLIHSFNHLWFKYIKTPHLAFGNIIILEKT